MRIREGIGVALANSIPFLHHAEMPSMKQRDSLVREFRILKRGTDVECDSGKGI
jgi:hypothetical protein